MCRAMMVLAAALAGCIPVAFGQQDSVWGQWHSLVGEWVGQGSGKPGEGTGRFSLYPDLDGRVLIRKGHAEYPKTPDRPGVIHDDLMVVYRDPSGRASRAVYFDNEGHVINYSIACTSKSIILMSEAGGQAPVFRLTYSMLEPDLVDIKFEMSRDGVNFQTYTQGPCRRVK